MKHGTAMIGLLAVVGTLMVAPSCSNKRIASDLTLAPLPSAESTTPRSTTSSAPTTGSSPGTGTTNPNVTRPTTGSTVKPSGTGSQPANQSTTQPSVNDPTATTQAAEPGTPTVTTPMTTAAPTPGTTPVTTPGPPPPTTRPTTPPTTTPPPDGGAATAVLAAITVAAEHKGAPGFKNNSFKTSIKDASGCDTVARVLIRDSTTTAQTDAKGCKVTTGTWVSPWDQTTWTDPHAVTLDRVVALKEAWDSGAWSWSQQRRDAFANDTSDSRTLTVVSDSVSQAKGDSDPAGWLPPSAGQVCRYIADWLSIKARWGLTMDAGEAAKIGSLLNGQCAGLQVDSWPGVS